MSKRLKTCLLLLIPVLCILYTGLFVRAQSLLLQYRSTWYLTVPAGITAACISVILQKLTHGKHSVRCTVYTLMLALLVLFMVPTLKTHRQFTADKPGVYQDTWGYLFIPFGDTEAYQVPYEEYKDNVEYGDHGMRQRNLTDRRTYRRFTELGLICLLTSGIPTFIYLAAARKNKPPASQ